MCHGSRTSRACDTVSNLTHRRPLLCRHRRRHRPVAVCSQHSLKGAKGQGNGGGGLNPASTDTGMSRVLRCMLRKWQQRTCTICMIAAEARCQRPPPPGNAPSRGLQARRTHPWGSLERRAARLALLPPTRPGPNSSSRRTCSRGCGEGSGLKPRTAVTATTCTQVPARSCATATDMSILQPKRGINLTQEPPPQAAFGRSSCMPEAAPLRPPAAAPPATGASAAATVTPPVGVTVADTWDPARRSMPSSSAGGSRGGGWGLAAVRREGRRRGTPTDHGRAWPRRQGNQRLLQHTPHLHCC